MSTFLSEDIQRCLDEARQKNRKRTARLSVMTREGSFPILDQWKTGFAVDCNAPHLRGFVDLFDGSNHSFQCLIVASEVEGNQIHYEFKRATAVSSAPPADFEIAPDRPVALIEKLI
ncbi:MAG: hypothetical protein AAFR19_14535 [Pseudomonadota bacterium]